MMSSATVDGGHVACRRQHGPMSHARIIIIIIMVITILIVMIVVVLLLIIIMIMINN